MMKFIREFNRKMTQLGDTFGWKSFFIPIFVALFTLNITLNLLGIPKTPLVGLLEAIFCGAFYIILILISYEILMEFSKTRGGNLSQKTIRKFAGWR